MDTEKKAEKWLFERSRSQLVAVIGKMGEEGSGGFCSGPCGESVASYLRDTVWSGYRDQIATRLNKGDGELPDSKGQRQIRLLTRYEYLNTIDDVLGVALPEERFSNYVPGRYLLFPTIQARTVSDLYLSEYLWGAMEIQNRVNVNSLAGCNLENVECIDGLIGNLGKKLFHRPLSVSERNAYVSMGQNEGVPVALAAMVLSPKFLYLSEVGEPDLLGDGYQLSQYETANALAYGYTGRGPDEQLWSMAEEGSLNDAAIREIQARRLIASEAGKAYLAEFFMPLLEVSEVKLASKQETLGEPLITAMKKELKRLVSDVIVENPSGLDGLYNPGFTFINDTLASHYSMDGSGLGDTMSKVGTRDEHGGLLHLGIFHTANSDKVATHPMIRARVVRENLLCKDLGTPVVDIPKEIKLPELASTRDFWTAANGPDSGVCWSCHIYMNDIGFALDVFDVLGRYRTMELIKGFGSQTGNEATFTLDTRGTFIIDDRDVAFDNLRGMTKAIANSSNGQACLATQYLRFVRGRGGDSTDAAYLKDVYGNSGKIIDLMVSQVKLPSFVRKQ